MHLLPPDEWKPISGRGGVELKVMVRVGVTFRSLGLSFTEYIHAGVIELVLDDFR